MEYNKEQQAVLDSRASRLLVSASAGSGKTTIMIERIVGLIGEGHSLKNMLVSTFTKASAADMRAKIYDKLLLASRNNAELKKELAYLPLADVTNLHSWCQRKIAEYFYRLGLDPNFGVMDASECDAALDECMDTVISREIEEGSPEFLLLYEILLARRKDTRIREYVKDIYRFAFMQPDPDEWLRSAALAGCDSRLKSSIKEADDKKKARLIGRIDELERVTARAKFNRNLEHIDELRQYVSGVQDKLRRPYGAIPPECEQLNNAFKAIKEESKKLVEKIRGYQFPESGSDDENAAVLVRMATRLAELYAERKSEKAQLDFADLEHYMLILLSDPVASAEIKERYKYIFVDEYQDINPLQEAILTKLGENSVMFYVGDVKQSIYAFRGCEPDIFLDKYRSYRKNGDGEVVRLNTNYRSDKRILDFCNNLFSAVMSEDFGGMDYSADGMFVAGRKNNGLGVELNLVAENMADVPSEVVCSKGNDGNQAAHKNRTEPSCNGENSATDTVYSVKNHNESRELSLAGAEQNLIVNKIFELMNCDVTEKGKKRPASLSDIVILVRSAGEYTAALKSKINAAGIEVSIAEKLNFASEHVTAVLLEYLSLINNFDNDIALLTVMRSVFGGFSDEELARIRAACPHTRFFFAAVRAYKNKDALGGKITAFFQQLNHYYSLSLSLPADELTGRIVADADYFKYVFGMDDGRSKSAFLESFLKFIIDSPYKRNVNSFLKSLGVSAGVDAGCSVRSDAVRIMTVHSSKGLEFPFVIFADVCKRFNTRDLSDSMILDKDYGVCLKLWDDAEHTVADSPKRMIAGERLRKTMIEEELRILYVALTRAIDGLYIFGSLPEKFDTAQLYGISPALVDFEKGNSFLEWLVPVMKESATVYAKSDCTGIENEGKELPLLVASRNELSDRIRTRISFEYPQSKAPRKTFVTAAVRDSLGHERHSPALFQSAENALERGSAYHKAMELIDFCAVFSEEWKKLPDGIRQLVEEKDIAVAVGKMRGLVSDGKLYKELPFILNCPYDELTAITKSTGADAAKTSVGSVSEGRGNSDTTLLQGVIDALIIHSDGAIIVDYKTTRGENILSGEYVLQTALYAKAVREILGVPVKKMLVYSFDRGAFIDTASGLPE